MRRIRFLPAVCLSAACAFFPPGSFSQDAPSSIGEIRVQAGPAETAAPPTPKDDSGLWFHSGTRAYLLVVNARGQRTGVDPLTQQTLQEIPGSACEADFIANRYTGEEHAELDERITLQPARRGTYDLHLTGLQPGPYEVSIAAQATGGSSLPSKDLDGLISEGQEKIFKLTFDPAPGSTLRVLDESKN